jgi:hypothetical protein
MVHITLDMVHVIVIGPFNIDDEKGKMIWIDENCFRTHLSTFGSKALLTMKIMDFENVGLTKVVTYMW